MIFAFQTITHLFFTCIIRLKTFLPSGVCYGSPWLQPDLGESDTAKDFILHIVLLPFTYGWFCLLFYFLRILTVSQQVDGEVSVVVLCHTRELAFQISKEYERFSKYMPTVKAAVFFGGETITFHSINTIFVHEIAVSSNTIVAGVKFLWQKTICMPCR